MTNSAAVACMPQRPLAYLRHHSSYLVFLQGGIYHGRIILPPEYPFKPPSFIMISPSGRFETGVKICLSMSSHHPEHWQPSWSVRVALVALIAFLPTSGHGAIGSLVSSGLLPRLPCCTLHAWHSVCNCAVCYHSVQFSDLTLLLFPINHPVKTLSVLKVCLCLPHE